MICIRYAYIKYIYAAGTQLAATSVCVVKILFNYLDTARRDGINVFRRYSSVTHNIMCIRYNLYFDIFIVDV